MTRWLPLLLAGLAAAAPVYAQAVREDAFRKSSDGTLTHVGSGMNFPESVAGFTRTRDAVFDMRGEYVGVAYSKPLGGRQSMTLRVAVVHIEQMTPRAHYTIAKPLALRDVAGARTLAEGVYQRPEPGRTGYYGLFAGTRNGAPVRVGLWTFDQGYWDVRAIAAFPPTRQAEARSSITEFVSAFRGLGQRYSGPAQDR